MGRFITQLGQSTAILVFIIILGAVMGYLGYSDTSSSVVPEQSDTTSKRGSIDLLANFEIDFSILEDEDYKALEIFGENPVNPGITGERRNPFAPI